MMRVPSMRFTIGGLMILVFLAGLTFWGRRVVLVRLTPSITELQALANYQQAKLTREVAEFAMKEHEQGIAHQDLAQSVEPDAVARFGDGRGFPQDDLPILRWKQDHPPSRDEIRTNLVPGPVGTGLRNHNRPSRDQQLNSLKGDINKARANELFEQGVYRQERAKRLWPSGL